VSATLPAKLYFRIGEVSGLVGVEPHVLRYWEREFARTIRPTKSAKGQRVYSRRDVENLMKVRELLYTEGFTIAGARKQLSGSRSAAPLASDEEAADAGVTAAADAAPEFVPSTDPPSLDGGRAHVSAQLRQLRDELQAFLAELGG
jgi:DNA-binding transcriptional MerR regulator